MVGQVVRGGERRIRGRVLEGGGSCTGSPDLLRDGFAFSLLGGRERNGGRAVFGATSGTAVDFENTGSAAAGQARLPWLKNLDRPLWRSFS